MPRDRRAVTPRFPPRPWKWALLATLFALGVWYLGHDLVYAATRDRSDVPAVRGVILLAHLATTLPLLLLPPVQFSRRVRARWPEWHHRAGVLYLTSAIVAACGALYLGATFDEAGRRVPLVVFATLWLGFSIAAWVCARRRAFAMHEQFVVRSYGIALAFVFIRLLGDVQGSMFTFIADEGVRGVTREWLSFVVPLLLIEAWFTWWPAVRRTYRPSPTTA